MKSDALMAAGLTFNEAKVYLALLKLGSSSVNEITKKAGVHRVNVYDILNRLKEKGLASSIMVKGKRYFDPVDPNQLLKILERREAEVKDALPELMLDFTLKKVKQDVYYFKGPDSVMNAYRMMLEQNDKVLYAMGGSGLNRTFLKHRHKIWDIERKKLGIKIKGLYYENFRGQKLGDEDWEIKFLPNEFQNPAMIDIIGNLVIILLATDEVIGIVIENQQLAESYKKHFMMLWDYVAKK
ncbi:MAG: helix-turn-helix domain-containing protein [Candidatus Woesearchaeota archaeon]